MMPSSTARATSAGPCERSRPTRVPRTSVSQRAPCSPTPTNGRATGTPPSCALAAAATTSAWPPRPKPSRRDSQATAAPVLTRSISTPQPSIASGVTRQRRSGSSVRLRAGAEDDSARAPDVGHRAGRRRRRAPRPPARSRRRRRRRGRPVGEAERRRRAPGGAAASQPRARSAAGRAGRHVRSRGETPATAARCAQPGAGLEAVAAVARSPCSDR